MKTKLLFILLLITGSSVFCQPAIKVYAYEQDVLPGTIPVGTDENGNSIRKAADKKNYRVFLSFKSGFLISPVEIYIRGKSFSIKGVETKKTPVGYINNNIPPKPETIELVPATKNKVVQLQVGDEPQESKRSSHLKKLTEKNEVVIEYLLKKKRYFLTVQKLRKLEPVANE
jgi:hypothetical protein